MDELLPELWPSILYHLVDGLFPMGPQYPSIREKWLDWPIFKEYTYRETLDPAFHSGDQTLSYLMAGVFKPSYLYEDLVKAQRDAALHLVILSQTSASLRRVIMPFFKVVHEILLRTLFEIAPTHEASDFFCYALPLPSHPDVPIPPVQPEFYAYAVYGLVYNHEERLRHHVHFLRVQPTCSLNTKGLGIFVNYRNEWRLSDIPSMKDACIAWRMVYRESKYGDLCEITESSTVREALASSASWEAIDNRHRHILRMMHSYANVDDVHVDNSSEEEEGEEDQQQQQKKQIKRRRLR